MSLKSVSSNEANTNTTWVTHREQYVKDDDTLYNEGDKMTNPNYARTLEVIAEGGAKEFYTGDLAKKMVADIKEAGERGSFY